MSNLLVLVLTVVSMLPGNHGWKGRTNASASEFGLTTPRPLRGSTLISWKSLTPNDHCTKEDGREGRCVLSYLCVDGRKINDDGSDLTDERTLECEAPAVCCPLNEKVLETTTGKLSTLVPGVVTKPTGPGSDCEAVDGSSGRCLYPHLCTNDSTVIDGSDILDERTIDPCPNWQGAIQICCPESYWKGKIDEGDKNMTTPTPDPKPNDKDETCKSATREAGICVPFYQCERDDDFDGADVINVRYTTVRECGFTKTCCPKSNVDKSKPPPTPPPSNKCGVANPNGIVYRNITGNTNEARYGEFPWMVAVRTRTGPGDSFNTTGGSIVHPWVVLTAAHYVARAVDEDVRVRGGEWDTLTKDEPLPYQERNVRKIVLHPEFNNRNKHNDIALLFLTTAFTPAPHVGVVCLPPQGQRAQPSTDCVANGWGKDKFGRGGHLQNILKKTILPVMSPADCQSRLRNTRLGPFYKLHTGFMCAGGERLDTCTQDGGGPLACPTLNDPNQYVQHGIVSWGIGCGQDGVPGVYVDVGQYRSWIDQEIAKEGYTLDGSVEE